MDRSNNNRIASTEKNQGYPSSAHELKIQQRVDDFMGTVDGLKLKPHEKIHCLRYLLTHDAKTLSNDKSSKNFKNNYEAFATHLRSAIRDSKKESNQQEFHRLLTTAIAKEALGGQYKEYVIKSKECSDEALIKWIGSLQTNREPEIKARSNSQSSLPSASDTSNEEKADQFTHTPPTVQLRTQTNQPEKQTQNLPTALARYHQEEKQAGGMPPPQSQAAHADPQKKMQQQRGTDFYAARGRNYRDWVELLQVTEMTLSDENEKLMQPIADIFQSTGFNTSEVFSVLKYILIDETPSFYGITVEKGFRERFEKFRETYDQVMQSVDRSAHYDCKVALVQRLVGLKLSLHYKIELGRRIYDGPTLAEIARLF